MACTLTLTGRSLPCRDALGGVKKVWIVNTAGGLANTSFTDDLWVYDANVGDVTGKNGTVAKDYVSPKNTSSFTQTVNASVENGTVFYTQVLSLVLNKPVVADIVELTNLAKGRLGILVQDNNDNYFVMGHTRGAELTGGSLATGTALGDLNGYTLEFTAEEAIPAPFWDTTDTTNVTLTPTA